MGHGELTSELQRPAVRCIRSTLSSKAKAIWVSYDDPNGPYISGRSGIFVRQNLFSPLYGRAAPRSHATGCCIRAHEHCCSADRSSVSRSLDASLVTVTQQQHSHTPGMHRVRTAINMIPPCHLNSLLPYSHSKYLLLPLALQYCTGSYGRCALPAVSGH